MAAPQDGGGGGGAPEPEMARRLENVSFRGKNVFLTYAEMQANSESEARDLAAIVVGHVRDLGFERGVWGVEPFAENGRWHLHLYGEREGRASIRLDAFRPPGNAVG